MKKHTKVKIIRLNYSKYKDVINNFFFNLLFKLFRFKAFQKNIFQYFDFRSLNMMYSCKRQSLSNDIIKLGVLLLAADRKVNFFFFLKNI